MMDVLKGTIWVRMSPLLLAFTVLMSGLGCGTQTALPLTVEAPATVCTAMMAQILIGDGFMRVLCGCTGIGETAGTPFSSTSPLSCHLSSSTAVVFFHYSGTVLRHQIVPSGVNLFTPSPLSDPNSSPVFRVHAVTFHKANATYSFIDSFSSMQGQIFVP